MIFFQMSKFLYLFHTHSYIFLNDYSSIDILLHGQKVPSHIYNIFNFTTTSCSKKLAFCYICYSTPTYSKALLSSVSPERQEEAGGGIGFPTEGARGHDYPEAELRDSGGGAP